MKLYTSSPAPLLRKALMPSMFPFFTCWCNNSPLDGRSHMNIMHLAKHNMHITERQKRKNKINTHFNKKNIKENKINPHFDKKDRKGIMETLSFLFLFWGDEIKGWRWVILGIKGLISWVFQWPFLYLCADLRTRSSSTPPTIENCEKFGQF